MSPDVGYVYLSVLISIAKRASTRRPGKMKVHIQLNLLIVAALYLVWALFLFMGQQQAHPMAHTMQLPARCSVLRYLRS